MSKIKPETSKMSGPDVTRNRAGRTIVIEASPSRIEIQTSNTAVIVVDMQNDFGSKGGMFDQAGIANP